MGRLDGRVAIVTGGGRGLGRAIALAFAAEGARVAVAGRSARDLHAVVAEVEKLGASAPAVTTAVTAETSVRALVDGIVAVTTGFKPVFESRSRFRQLDPVVARQ